MTLENLLGRLLERIEPDDANVGRLLEAAKRSLADAQLAEMSNEGRFDMAYKCIMQSANAALQANGFRTLTSTPGHHQTMIQSLPRTIGLDGKAMVVLDSLRKQRNVADYSGEPISAAMAQEAVVRVTELLEQVQQWLREHKAGLS